MGHRYICGRGVKMLEDPEVSRLYLGEEAGTDITRRNQNGEKNE